MDLQISRLLDAFGRSGRSFPADIPAFLKGLPGPGSVPIPWETWTLIGLVRHRQRQIWVRNMILTRLQGDITAIAKMGAFGHPKGINRTGSLPGSPEWEYCFHGRGCCLTHKVTGEEIDVDFWNDSAEYFDFFFYQKHLESLSNPEAPERRLRELHRAVSPIEIAVKRLLATGALVPLDGRESHAFRIAEEVLAHEAEIEALCRDWEFPDGKVCRAAILGDWIAAHAAAAGHDEIQQITGPQAERCRAMRRKQLLEESGHSASDALFGLAELGGADEQIEAAFGGPPSGLISAALEIVGQQDDPKWYPIIYALFKRMKPTGQLPEPHIWITSLTFLLRHGYRTDEMKASLPQAGRTEFGEAVLLALENAPEHVLPLVRRGLRSSVICDRETVAAILALIARPWSLRELSDALQTTDEQEPSAEIRAALLETGDPEAEKIVMAWEERNPHENETGYFLEIHGRQVGPFYSMAEHWLKNRAAYVRFNMDSLYDRIMQCREVVPRESPASNS